MRSSLCFCCWTLSDCLWAAVLAISSSRGFVGVRLDVSRRVLFFSPPFLGVSAVLSFLGTYVSSDFLFLWSRLMSRRKTGWVPAPHLFELGRSAALRKSDFTF